MNISDLRQSAFFLGMKNDNQNILDVKQVIVKPIDLKR